MRMRNKEKLCLHKIQEDIMLDLFKMSATQIVKQMDHKIFARIVYELPENSLHYSAVLMRLKEQFIEIEEYMYIIPIQQYLEGE